MNTQLLTKIQKEISRAISSPEEAELLVKALAETDWRDCIEYEAANPNRYGHCQVCRERTRWAYLIHIKGSRDTAKCCYHCYPHVIKNCIQCGIEYLPNNLDNLPPADMSYCSSCMICEGTYYQGLGKERFWKEYRIVSANRYRAKSLGSSATLTANEWIAIIKYFDWKCAYCLSNPYECMDHLIPISKNGGTTVLNCVPSCRDCNNAKGDKHPDDMAASHRQIIARVRKRLNEVF